MIFNSFHAYSGIGVGENFAFWFEGFFVIFLSLALLEKRELFSPALGRIGFIIGGGMLIYTLEQFGGAFEWLGAANIIIHAGFLVWLAAIALSLLQGNGKLGRIKTTTLLTGYVILLLTAYL